MTMSIPLVVFVLLLTSTVRGLAIAIMMQLKAINLNTSNKGFSLATKDCDPLNPSSELIFKVVVVSFLFQYNQAIASGRSRNNQKNSGFKNVTFPIIVSCFEVRQSLVFYLKWYWHIDRLLRER